MPVLRGPKAVRLLSKLGADPDRLYLRLAMMRAGAEVTQPGRFALNELLLRRRVRRYRLSSSSREILLRHPLSDAWVLDEVMHRENYRPPPAVMAVLSDLPELRIADLGGHIGLTTLYLLDLLPTARAVAYEPNPESFRLFAATIAANHLDDRCELVPAAAGVSAGRVRLTGFSLLAHVVRAEEADSHIDELARSAHADQAVEHDVAVRDVLPLLARIDLLKMDIEGGEWAILADPRFRDSSVRALVLEYHPQANPAGDTTDAVRGLLAAAGFTSGEPFDVHDGVGMLWAWRDGATPVR